MQKFSEQYPEQFYDVGIAEQHAFVFASGHPRRHDRHPALARQERGAVRHLVRVEKGAAVRRHPARFRHEPVRHLADRQAIAADHPRDDHDVARRGVAAAQAAIANR